MKKVRRSLVVLLLLALVIVCSAGVRNPTYIGEFISIFLDNISLQFGSGGDYGIVYDSADSRLELNSGSTSETILSINDNASELDLYGDLDLNTNRIIDVQSIDIIGLSGGSTVYGVGSANGTNGVYWTEPSGTTNWILFTDAP